MKLATRRWVFQAAEAIDHLDLYQVEKPAALLGKLEANPYDAQQSYFEF
jgi:hypothetical protein